MTEPSIFELSNEKEQSILPNKDTSEYDLSSDIPREYLRESSCGLPRVSEVDLVRHFTHLSQLNYGVDSGFYPLGSCTMKYNPKINEKLSGKPEFSELHPYQPQEFSQGTLEILYTMQQYLCEICGMDRFSLQPSAGAHGEFAGLLIIRAYHSFRGEKRTKILVPDSSHGTNPASAFLAGFQVHTIPSNENGEVDLEALDAELGDDVAALMLTNPNTLGIFESQILTIANIVHQHGALLYYDGANLNALLGTARPGDMGFDIIHVNLHKTFSTPHGGGGPGSGPIGVSEALQEFLPVPVVVRKNNSYELNYDLKNTIGQMRSFYGNIAVVLKAYCYIRALGKDGLSNTGKAAVIHANYLMNKLKKAFHLPYNQSCMHEFVLSASKQNQHDVHAVDIAKRLLDMGFHAPTVYFPLIVKEALMIEPTETETKRTLDRFCDAMLTVAEEARSNPQKLKDAPVTTPVSRLDEVKAAKDLRLTW